MHSKDLTNFTKECRKRGLNITYPRMVIYKILLNHRGHPSAEDIFISVKKEYPNISLATVYKTLEMLAQHDLIAKVTPLHDIARYDCNNHFHHHFVCVNCKKIIDIENEELNKLSIPKEIESDCKVFNYRVQFDGLCKECQ